MMLQEILEKEEKLAEAMETNMAGSVRSRGKRSRWDRLEESSNKRFRCHATPIQEAPVQEIKKTLRLNPVRANNLHILSQNHKLHHYQVLPTAQFLP